MTGSATPPNERQLALFWLTGLVNSRPFHLADGRPFGVIYRGRHNFGPGPDFRNAILEIGGKLVRGDVELHVRSQDWSGHGHNRDERYDGVVLHVVWHSDDSADVCTRSGARPLVLSLSQTYGQARALQEAIADAAPTIEPYHAWIQALDANGLGEFLDACGDQRFHGRSDRFESDLAAIPRDEVLYRGLLDAVAYGQNRAPARELASRLPLGLLSRLHGASSPIVALEAALIGAAGMLPSQRADDLALVGNDLTEARVRTDLWEQFEPTWGETPLCAAAWQWNSSRPANSPIRRLAGMAQLVFRHLRHDLLVQATDILIASESDRIAYRRLVSLATVDGRDTYWGDRSDFGRPLDRASRRLIGEERAADIVINVMLPLAAAIGATDGDRQLVSAAHAMYARAPRLASNWITREMQSSVIGPGRQDIVTTARRQQGLIELYQTCCDERRCATCPVGQTAQKRWRPREELT
ncbi:MAG TPA: DUF2851 family protein [Chloroflexota bacterium]|nr:DUF2851 family protein [Chloroflexota bacterium]